MKNNTNIYDIDGNLIRKAGDNHKFTIEEVEEMVDGMTEMVERNPDNEVYKVYLNNLHKYLGEMYKKMSEKEIAEKLASIQTSLQRAHNEAVEVEEKGLKDVNDKLDQLKDEYTEFEEINETDKEDIHPLHSGSTDSDSGVDKELLEDPQ